MPMQQMVRTKAVHRHSALLAFEGNKNRMDPRITKAMQNPVGSRRRDGLPPLNSKPMSHSEFSSFVSMLKASAKPPKPPTKRATKPKTRKTTPKPPTRKKTPAGKNHSYSTTTGTGKNKKQVVHYKVCINRPTKNKANQCTTRSAKMGSRNGHYRMATRGSGS
jgi:hypothetical protein